MKIGDMSFDATFQFPKAHEHRDSVIGLRDKRIWVQAHAQIWVRLIGALKLTTTKQQLADAVWAGYLDEVWVGGHGMTAEQEANERGQCESVIGQKLQEAFNNLRTQGWKVNDNLPEDRVEISCQ